MINRLVSLSRKDIALVNLNWYLIFLVKYGMQKNESFEGRSVLLCFHAWPYHIIYYCADKKKLLFTIEKLKYSIAAYTILFQ